MKLKDNEELTEAIDDLKRHLADKYDGPIGAIGFALDEDDREGVDSAIDGLVEAALRVRFAAYTEDLDDAERSGPRIVLVSRRGWWSAGSTLWQALRRLPCLPDLMYVTDDPEPVVYQHGGIGVHEGKTLVTIPLCRDKADKALPVEFA